MRLAMMMALSLLSAGQAFGQTEPATVEFHFERPGMPVPAYTFRLEASGDADYRAVNAPVANRYGMVVPGTNETVQRLQGPSGMVRKLLAQVQRVQDLANCASRRKGIADTGMKTLSLQVDHQEVIVCHYNYSENTVVQEVTREFQAMAYMLDMGRKMERDERFDRLALDADMTTLVEAVKGGQALGAEWIAGTLEGLVKDPAVLERVRNQAAKLLEQSAAER